MASIWDRYKKEVTMEPPNPMDLHISKLI